MEQLKEQNGYFRSAGIGTILLKMAPPVMLAQLIALAVGTGVGRFRRCTILWTVCLSAGFRIQL